MLSIYHARLNLVHYLHSVDSLEEHRDQIVFIGRTECFTDDLEAFKRRLGIGREIHAPQDAVGAHKNPDNLDRNLSDIASSNLQQWHDEDYLIYHWCLDRRRMLLGG